MNVRERYAAALTFEKPDKIPLEPGAGRESTRERWHGEGLPEGRDPFLFALETLGINYEMPQRKWVALNVDFRMRPTFEEKILEHRDGHYVVQDWKGNICEISDRYDTRYLRNAIDFVTRRWIKCPVETHADWENMKSRYALNASGRFPDDFAERCRIAKQRDWPLIIYVNGPFWQLREWCGFEQLCMLMIDEPDFVMEMADFWKNFVSKTLERILENVVIDSLQISEDMAYKAKSMISMDMAHRFCMPAWREWSSLVKSYGCRLVDMDSDGFIGELIPLWIKAGINVCDPVEVAAHCDIAQFRREHDHKMAYRMGIDKRCIAAGGDKLETEIRRIEPVVRNGGYIPGCDHGIPADVSLENYLVYCRRVAEITGWL